MATSGDFNLAIDRLSAATATVRDEPSGPGLVRSCFRLEASFARSRVPGGLH
jgi:hypothetical protein